MQDISVYSCKCVVSVQKICFHFKFDEKKSIDFGIATLASKTTFLALVFAAPRCGLKRQFILYLLFP